MLCPGQGTGIVGQADRRPTDKAAEIKVGRERCNDNEGTGAREAENKQRRSSASGERLKVDLERT